MLHGSRLVSSPAAVRRFFAAVNAARRPQSPALAGGEVD